MTLHSSFLRLLYFLGLCAWLSIQSAGSPSVRAGNSEGANAKPIAHFTDIAQKAGLTTPVIFGGENTKKYIIETTGTGVDEVLLRVFAAEDDRCCKPGFLR